MPIYIFVTSRTLTVNVNAEVEKKFRQVAKATQGGKKGYLGKALTDAMQKWTDEKEATVAVAAAMAMLAEGLDLGGLRNVRRVELHGR